MHDGGLVILRIKNRRGRAGYRAHPVVLIPRSVGKFIFIAKGDRVRSVCAGDLADVANGAVSLKRRYLDLSFHNICFEPWV